MARKIGQKYSYFILFILLTSASTLKAQFLLNSDSAFKAAAPNSGRLWGYAFGDYYYKGHADSLNRGGNNQYTGIPQGRNTFQFRRIYLGYDYNISKKFSVELLLAAEDNFPAGNPPSSTSNAASGDILGDSKTTFYIKLANLRIKNLWKGTDLILGQQTTPTFAMMSEKVWNYRSSERTITDVDRTSSYDLGAGLNGVFDPATRNFGYNLLVATGSGDKPSGTSYKWFYGDVWAMFFNKKLIIDLYSDYQRLNWQTSWHHDRQMNKIFVAYNTPIFTFGAEGYINTLRNDTKATLVTPVGSRLMDTINTSARGLSLFAHGDIVKEKLRWFARWDTYNPNHNINNSKYKGYAPNGTPNGYGAGTYRMTFGNNGAPTGNAVPVGDPTSPTVGDITYKQQFVNVGLDFTPIHNVHLEPNIWYTHYASQLPTSTTGTTGTNGNSDLVYRLTFFFIFGKSYKNTHNQF